jgi:hypothetical protein
LRTCAPGLKSRTPAADAIGVDGISGSGSPSVADQAAVAVAVKGKETVKVLTSAMVKLIDACSSGENPPPPDATFHTYA